MIFLRLNGKCDVVGCDGGASIVWMDVIEKRQHRLCIEHSQDRELNPWDIPIPGPPASAYSTDRSCSCGEPLLKGHRLCGECKKLNHRQRSQRAYEMKKAEAEQPEPSGDKLICKNEGCEKERIKGYSYCEKCSNHKRVMARRKARIEYRRRSRS